MSIVVYDENRVWVRITNYCNSNCKFCLDGDIQQRGGEILKSKIFEQIKDDFRPGMKNKIIISGGEASTHPNFLEYVKYAKDIGYSKIQTITNGIKWGDTEFCKQAVESGLDEITFSLHGHSPAVHDYLTGIPGSFQNIIKAIFYFTMYQPQIIVNADIVVNKKNIDTSYKTVQLLKKLGVWEYDVLQIIPFGRARNKFQDELLFDDMQQAFDGFQKICKEGEDERVHMRGNRIFVNFLEGYEHMIQNVEKIEDEVANENFERNQKDFDSRQSFHCREPKRCMNCYLSQFCDRMESFYQDENSGKKSKDLKKYYKLECDKSIARMDEMYPNEAEDFIDMLQQSSKGKDGVINIPFCLVNKNNVFTDFASSGRPKTYKEFINRFMDEGFRFKGSKCKSCKYYEICDGVHANVIKKYGFKILKPINND